MTLQLTHVIAFPDKLSIKHHHSQPSNMKRIVMLVSSLYSMPIENHTSNLRLKSYHKKADWQESAMKFEYVHPGRLPYVSNQ